ncbi:peptidase domain-containing ABC transporter [Kozakia baliensis]|uniref:peptidase domain-containing ABC transporter n=1 Tax=Kozakia baliensis TaxID=153496 RepID=UPI0011BE0625
MVKAAEWGWKKRPPIVQQTEAAECGLACLAMILGYYGHQIDLATLRRKYAVSTKGMTLRDMVQIADRSGLSARAVRLELDEIQNLQLPCILHWGLNHFVVLTNIKRGKYLIHDPASGRKVRNLDQVSKEFTGVALELTPSEIFERKDERKTLRLNDLFRRIGGLRGALTQLFLLSLGLETIAIIMPIVSQIVIDEVIVTSDYELLDTIAIGLVFLLILQLAVGSVRQWAVLLLSTRVGMEWNAGLFDHLSKLPLDYFMKRHVGDIVSRFGSLNTIQSTLTTSMVQSVMDGLMAIGMAVMLFVYGGWLGGIALVALVLDIVLRLFTYRLYREAADEHLVTRAQQQSHFMETVRGMTSVKLLGLRNRRKVAWLNLAVDNINIQLRMQRYDLFYGRLGDLIFGADRLAMLVLGTSAVMRGDMSVGMLVAFLAYKDQFAGRVGSLVNSLFQLRMLNVQTDRLSDIIMTEPESSGLIIASAESSDVVAPGSEPATLTCENIAVRYSPHDPWIIKDISLHVPRGSSLTIMGPSGCGKTTLLKVMMGLIEPSHGRILIDGEDIRCKDLEIYRSQISSVLQDDKLFSGSLADNICAFDECPDLSWIEECARLASIIDDIRRMPMKFETLVGDMGSILSSGQRQRILFARALYRKPRILFLDEASSHLDHDNEISLLETMRNLRATIITVTHDKDFVLDHSNVISIASSDKVI